MEAASLKDRLKHVLWIGGSTCAGKSTAAETLAEQFGMTAYHFDRREPFHIYRAIPEEQPNLIRFMSRTMDERWVLRTPEEMLQEVIVCWKERFRLVLDDLLQMPTESMIVAEGAGFFPEDVAPLLSRPHQALWLVATPAFLAHVRSTRGRSVADNPHISDKDRAFRNLIERDQLIADYVRRQAGAHGYGVVEVDADVIEHVPNMVLDYLEVTRATGIHSGW
jgi:shikimate kinase